MSEYTLEERVTQLERELARLRQSVEGARPGVTGRTHPDLLDRYFGLFANSPNFDEVQQQIEADREREREEARRADEGPGE
jgi:hypothetical protein